MVETKALVDIICVTYNMKEYLDRFIRSLEFVDVPYRLIIWDNCSSDGTVELLNTSTKDIQIRTDNSFCRDIIEVFYNENIGYGKACNEGARKGDASWILFCNADIKFIYPILKDWIKIAEENNLTVSSVKQVNDDGKLVHAGIFGKFDTYLYRGWMEEDVGQYEELNTRISYVSGSAILTPRNVWKKLGGLLESPLYYEDVWYSRWAKENGYRIGYIGSLEICHSWNVSPKEIDKLVVLGKEAYERECKLQGIEENSGDEITELE